MSELGIQIAITTLRVGAVALVGLLLAELLGRRSPRAAARLLSTVCVLLIGTAAVSLVPLPGLPAFPPIEPTPSTVSPVATLASELTEAPGTKPAGAGVHPFALLQQARFVADIPAPSRGWRAVWAVLAFAYCGAVLLAFARTAIGYFGIRRLRKTSVTIIDADINRQACEIAGKLGFARPFTLHASPQVGVAATVSWRKPEIHLSPCWPTWSESELDAVLSHEIAHIVHGDFRAVLLARLSQAVNALQPLVRVLTSRLRWMQELAADNLASHTMQRKDAYLRSLAGLALRLPGGRTTAFNPLPAMTGGLLIRRMEMLKNRNGMERPNGLTRRLGVGLVALAAFVACSFAGRADDPKKTAKWTEEEQTPFETKYLARDSSGFLGLRPSVWLNQPGMELFGLHADAAVQNAAKSIGITLPDELKWINVEQIVGDISLQDTKGTGEPGTRSFTVSGGLVRMKSKVDWLKLLKSIPMFDVKAVSHSDWTVYQVVVKGVSETPANILIPDDRTIVVLKSLPGKDETLAKYLETLGRSTEMESIRKTLDSHAMVMTFDNKDGFIQKSMAWELGPVAKLFEGARLAFGTSPGGGNPVRIVCDAQDSARAEALKLALADFPKMLQPYMQELEHAAKEDKDDAARIWLQWYRELLASGKLTHSGNRLEWSASSKLHLGELYREAMKSVNPNEAKSKDGKEE